MKQISETASLVPGSGIREIVNAVLAAGPETIARLEIGEPDLATPTHIVEAAIDAARKPTGYTASAGVQRLREAIATRLQSRHQLSYDPSQIVVGQGAVQVLATIMAATINRGDEVLVPDPAWPNYEMQALLYGGVVRKYGLKPEHGFLPDPEEIESLITPRTRVLILNSPSNPTGAVIGQDLLATVIGLAEKHGILVVSDEVYDDLIYSGEHVSSASFAPDSVASVFSFSKTYSMTGWRVGYGAMPDWLAPTVARLQEPAISCLPTVSQAAALAALTGPQAFIGKHRDIYRSRRDLVTDVLNAAGIAVAKPAGAFYVMLPLSPGAHSRQSALDLVNHGVSTAPGNAFGTVAESHLRLSLASSVETIQTGLDRILDWYEKTDGGLSLANAAVPV